MKPEKQRYRLISDYRSYVNPKHLYAKAGEVVTLVKDHGPHNNMLLVRTQAGTLVGIRRDNLTPIHP